MPRQKNTRVTVSALQHVAETYCESCVILEMKSGEVDGGVVTRKHANDLGRAIQVFRIYADTSDVREDGVFEVADFKGPYSVGDGVGLMVLVFLGRRNGVSVEAFSARVRTGVNGVSSLLKQNGYTVKVKIKPVEQLPIPGTEGAPASEPAPTPAAETPEV
jgi:hypothetical protein